MPNIVRECARVAYWTLTLQLPSKLRQRKIARTLLDSGLFDTEFYLSENPDVAQAGIDPIAHYLSDGVSEGRKPNLHFDTIYYLQQNPAVATAGINPLLHYLVEGFKQGSDPSSEFSGQVYFEQNPDVAARGTNPLSHFLKYGRHEGRPVPLNPHCTKAIMQRLSNSGLFDPAFYLTENPDVEDAGMDPLFHYISEGAGEGRNPNPYFDTTFYLRQNPDVAASGVNPLLHYCEEGFKVGREPSPLFSGQLYIWRYPDVPAPGLNPLSHFLKFGKAEGKKAIPIPGHNGSVHITGSPGPESDHLFSYMDDSDEDLILPSKVAIGASSRGNFFMAEIANMMENAFRKLGVQARRFNENEARGVAQDEAVVVVAPHEFFLLGEGPAAFEALKGQPTLVMVNTEQLQTKWFLEARKYLSSATAVFDISYESAQQIANSGATAFFLPLGYSDYIDRAFDGSPDSAHPLLQHMSATMLGTLPVSYPERPIDVLFVGTSSPRRNSFFAGNARYFANKNTFIYLPAGDSPFLPDEARTIDFATFVGLVRRSKILLNIHRDAVPYLEWQRIVTLGIAQRTLVITDHCEPEPCIQANLDYLDAPLEGIPALCELALNDPQTAGAIAQRAYERLKAEYRMEDILGRCWSSMKKKAR